MQKTTLMAQPNRLNGDYPLFIHKPYVGREDEFQKAIAIYLKFNSAFWFHSPNGGFRDAKEGAKFKAMGVLPGVPDCMVLNSNKGFNGLAIELKVGNNKPTEHQLSVANQLVSIGWLVVTTWSLDDAITLIDWYFE